MERAPEERCVQCGEESKGAKRSEDEVEGEEEEKKKNGEDDEAIR